MSTIVNIEVQRDGQVVDQKSFNKEAIKIGGRATSDLHCNTKKPHKKPQGAQPEDLPPRARKIAVLITTCRVT